MGYTTPSLYEVVSFLDQGVPYARTTATVLPHPEHPEWASMMFFAHRGVESVESAAMRDPPHLLRAAPGRGDAHYAGVVPGYGPTRPGLA
jgi:hypothetical protein